MVDNVASPPRISIKQPSHRRTPTSSRCINRVKDRCHCARKPKMSLAPSSDDVPHWSSSSKIEQPVVVRCKSSHPMLSMPQAPSSDAIPHQTDSHQASPAAAVAASSPPNKHAATPDHHHNDDRLHVSSVIPVKLASMPPPPIAPKTNEVQYCQSRVGYLETTPRRNKESTTPITPLSFVRKLNRMFTHGTPMH